MPSSFSTFTVLYSFVSTSYTSWLIFAELIQA